MFQEVDVKIWEKEIVWHKTSIFDEPEYLETLSALYKTTIKYWIVYKKNKSIIGFATHIKNNSVIVPNHYSYSSFWFDKSLTGEFAFFEHLEQAVSKLKANFRFITFRLPPHIKDIRAFNYHGFSAKVNYTNKKSLNIDVDHRADLKRKLSKSLSQGYTFSYDKFYEDVLTQQIGDFNSFGYTNKQSKFYGNCFRSLVSSGLLKSFAVHKENKLVASLMMVVDFKNKQAYNLLVSASKTNYVGDASTFLYHNMFNCMKQSGIEFIDLYGADMMGIANYKAGFKGELENHYTVSFGLKNKYIDPLIIALKKVIKSFL